MAYPAVVAEFADTLKWLRITHQERSLLEEIMHLEVPTKTTKHHVSTADRANPHLHPTSGRTNRRRSCNKVSKQQHQSNHRTSIRGAEVHGGRERTHDNHQRTNTAMTRKEALAHPFALEETTCTHVEEDHHAFVIPWQTSELPLWADVMDFEALAAPDACESVDQTSSPSESDCSAPSEDDTEEVELSHDYVKIPWSDDDTDW